jgi:hypothetical protein
MRRSVKRFSLGGQFIRWGKRGVNIGEIEGGKDFWKEEAFWF